MDVWLAGILDRFGEPPNRFHPVAWFGRLARGLEGRFYRDAVAAGGGLALLLVAAAAALGGVLERLAQALPAGAEAVLLALLLKPSFALEGLLLAASAVERALEEGLGPAREALSAIVSRPTGGLDAGQVRMAAIESLAENLVDSVAAPLFYYLLFGLEGAYLFRAANTLDAMWGYRDARYRRFGRVAARLDDLLAYLPARGVALLLAGGASLGPYALAREAGKTPSPNAGWPMAAVALRFGLRLEKPGVYVLNESGRVPAREDLLRVRARVAAVGALLLFAAGLLRWGVGA